MKAIAQHVHGRLLEENGRFALLLTNAKPGEKTADSLYLRFALVTLGREEHLFPGFLLDDWGKEVRGRKLYDWIAEFGEQFPRAEIFGFERSGQQIQFFLRSLELYATYPLYVFGNREEPVSAGKLLEAVLLPSASVAAPQQVKRPADLKRPLRRARVSWWQVPPTSATFDFSLLRQSPDPGF